MTSSLPSGDGTSTGTGPSSALDEDSTPGTGNEPDTARTAAGEDQVSAAPDVAVSPDTAPSPDAGDTSTAEEPAEGLDPEDAQDDLNPDSQRRATDRVELDGPALENDEMHIATKDLQASQDATAEAREYAADVRKQTAPETSPTGF